MSPDNDNLPRGSAFRLRFSLLALLLFVTLICLLLGWWQFVYTERQRLLAERAAIALRIENLKKTIADKWEVYMDIAIESESPESGSGQVVLEIKTKRLDHVEAELLRIENQQLERQPAGTGGNQAVFARRISDLKEQRSELERDIAKRSKRSVELEIRELELEQLQRIAEILTLRLLDIDIEVETRGISGKSNTKMDR